MSRTFHNQVKGLQHLFGGTEDPTTRPDTALKRKFPASAGNLASFLRSSSQQPSNYTN
jgi:hypothetical protein